MKKVDKIFFALCYNMTRINKIGGKRTTMFKRLLYCFSILAVAFVFVITPNQKGLAAALKDIPAKYATEINYLIDRKVITGYPDGTFRPSVEVTREEAATMIGRALGLNGTQRAVSFSDVKKDSYASGYIQSAVDRGIITGYDDGTFRPKEKITRGEMAYLLKRAFSLSKTSNIFFSDVPTSGTQYTAINAIVTAGLANGYPDGSFKPKAPIIRSEFSLLVARGLNTSFRVTYEAKSVGNRIVTATSLNVRSGPGTQYATIGSYKQGTTIAIYQTIGDWVYSSYGSLKGYVHRDYLAIPSNKKIIAIDPGHGGSDPGAVGFGLKEKDVTLSVSLKLKKLLEQKGVQVVMTRTTDTYVSLDKRVEIGVNGNADTFVSIHANASVYDSANGTETYYSTAGTRSESSKQLATFIQNRLYKAIGTNNRGVKNADFRVIYTNPLPATLVELGFITNKTDSAKLASDTYRNKMAEAIALGIVDYYNWKN
ncbi:N-acetylmuramoyl-L-alanine amidase [Cytobacillus firmus]|uniref:N-acetylmuramoyl-L-alanine amidase n=3 Tax=Bacillaceae TaxID=186817 RepID=A0A366JSL9_CYTFI|nr:N-acetylmuramoyl-L-alanine amidase [Cytobacillus firmus]TDX41731.1 N-acetylmuramoyl-L-alanine amidase [Cytobacillus oceanisediminis]